MDLTDEQKENLRIDLQMQRERHGLFRKTMSFLDLAKEGGFGIRRKKPGEKSSVRRSSAELSRKK